MQMKLSFLGAAQNVTGSKHLLEVDGTRVLIDCGFYQERQFKKRNWDDFPVPPSSIDAVLLTHAHLDHCGLLPKLVRDGFRGRIYCTAATAEIARIILLDSAKIQEEDAKHKRKRHQREQRTGPYPVEPLYTIDDAEASLSYFSPVKCRKVINISEKVQAVFHNAGHVLGSSVIKVTADTDSGERTILFSGDLGRPDSPIVCDPAVFEQADYVLIESTYGDRVHDDSIDIESAVADTINSAVASGGNIVIPSFALERSQDILYYINKLELDGRIPKLKIFLDSPMASRITNVFKKHSELYDEEMTEYVNNHESPFEQADLTLAGTAEQSKQINHAKAPVMIIAGSGMCTGGRIKYHLRNNITNSKSIIMFIGYQAVGTLGRVLVEGAKEVRILGQKYPVKAKIVRIHGFSAHADRNELFGWLKKLKTPPRKVFVVHGETGSANAFGDYIRENTGWQVDVPAYGDQAVLD